MLDDLFRFEEIRVTSLRPESREDFARRLSEELGKPVRAVATPEEALVGADIMVEASRLTVPTVLLRTEWVAPGTLVVPYGTISAVELSLTDVMDKIVVDDWGQATVGPFGALRPHVVAGRLTRERVHAELGQEDAMSFAFEAAEKLRRIQELVREVVACELLTAYQAWALGSRRAGTGSSGHIDTLGKTIRPVEEDRPLGGDISRLIGLLNRGAFATLS